MTQQAKGDEFLHDAPRISDIIAVQRSIDDLVSSLMDKDPDRRPADIAEVQRRLAAFSATASVVKPQSTRVRAFSRPPVSVMPMDDRGILRSNRGAGPK